MKVLKRTLFSLLFTLTVISSINCSNNLNGAINGESSNNISITKDTTVKVFVYIDFFDYWCIQEKKLTELQEGIQKKGWKIMWVDNNTSNIVTQFGYTYDNQ